MVGAQFNYSGSFQLLNVSLNAKNFSGGAAGAANSQSLQIYWNTINNVIVAVNKDGIIVFEFAAGSLVFANVGGAVNTYTANVPSITSLVAGVTFEGNITAATNTGASTLNVSGLGAKPIVDYDGNPIPAGSVETDSIYIFIYNAVLDAWELAGLASPSIPVDIHNAIVVTKTGNDTTGTGSLSAPVLTVQKGVDLATAGQTVWVAPGVYDETVTLKPGVSIEGFDKLNTVINGGVITSSAGNYNVTNITIQSTTGNVLSFSGTPAMVINATFFNTNILSQVGGGNTINYTNAAAGTSVKFTDSFISLAATSGAQRILNQSGTSAGLVSFDNVTVSINDNDATVYTIDGAAVFSAINSTLLGRATQAGTSNLIVTESKWTAGTVELLNTTSTGAATIGNSTLTTTLIGDIISGTGFVFYTGITFGGAGVDFANTLNAGAGATPLPVSKIRLATNNLVGAPVPPNGTFEFDGTDLFLTIGAARVQVTNVVTGFTGSFLTGAGTTATFVNGLCTGVA